jgi:hypothetical protein
VARHSPPSWLAAVPGEVYTLHLWPPYGNPEVQASGHYTGWTQEGRLAYRLNDHASGRGARLTQLQRQAGGTWVVADVEPGTRDREHQLKYRSASRRCSVCKAVRDIEAGEITKEEALARWSAARPADRAVLREIFGMEPEPPTPDPVPYREMIPARKPVVDPDITPEMDALVDSLCEGWLRQQAEAYAQAGAGAEVGPEAAPERAREVLRSELYAGVSAAWPPRDPQVQAEIPPGADVQLEARPHRAEAARELLHSDLVREVPAPRPAPEPQVQAEITAGADVHLEAWPPEAEPELEIG